MPRNDEGEFELVLGNRQLLSVFFVMVILMGVCFAGGYIIGRNSVGSPAAARSPKGGESAIVVDPTAGEAKSAAAKPAPATKVPERAPAPAPEVAKPVAVPPQPVAAAPAKPAATAAPGAVEPKAGETYLQVAAVKRPDADTLVGELRKKEFKAAVAPGPNESLFRVLVGPIQDSAEVNRQRTRLKELGFDPMVKRY